MGACVSTYISDEGEDRIIKYSYTEKDKSILKKRVFSPIADYLLNWFVPNCIGPYLLYILAFLFVLIPHIVIIVELSGDLQGNVPYWLSLITGVGLFLYLIFKNIAQKKAEKDSTPVPLNEFLDQQTDALNIFITGLSFFTIIQLGNTRCSVIAFLVAMVPFYTATWELYHTDNYERRRINGQNEGLAAVALLEIITAIFGSEMWPQYFQGELRANDIIVMVVGGFSLISVFRNIFNVWKKGKDKFYKAIFSLVMIIHTIAMMMIICYISVTDTVSRTARSLITYVGLFFAKYVGLLLIHHMSEQRFRYIYYSKIFAYTLLIANCVHAYREASGYIDEDFVILILTMFQPISYISFFIAIVQQIYPIFKDHKPVVRSKQKSLTETKKIIEVEIQEGKDTPNEATPGDIPVLKPKKTRSLPDISIDDKVIIILDRQSPFVF